MRTIKIHYPTLVALLLAALAIFPMAGADNNTTDPYHYLTNADHLAGPRDMSMYNPVITPVPFRTMNTTTARLYPNMTACGKDGCLPKSTACPFPFIPCEFPLTVMVVYSVNTTRPDPVGPVVAYSVSGWPLQNPVYIIPAGETDITLPFPFFQPRIDPPPKEFLKTAIPIPTPFPVTSPTPDFSTITPAPADDENLTARIEIDRDIIPANDTISFRFVNQGDHKLIFICGDPYHIERQQEGEWIRVAGAGGTMGFWSLKPGETSKNFSLNTAKPNGLTLFENLTTEQYYTFSPGRYRIGLEALISVNKPGQEVSATYTREFVIRPVI
ncbi:MAG: hypothetical protein M0Q92_11595 [Methanoregula sp.]|jgi:hypothetical protein|nr:hypothetical protein [Methanoregula sp.]